MILYEFLAVKTLTFDDDDDDDDDAMKGFYWNLKEALEIWETLPSCHSIESTVTCLKIAASLFSLFLQVNYYAKCFLNFEFLFFIADFRCEVLFPRLDVLPAERRRVVGLLRSRSRRFYFARQRRSGTRLRFD